MADTRFLLVPAGRERVRARCGQTPADLAHPLGQCLDPDLHVAASLAVRVSPPAAIGANAGLETEDLDHGTLKFRGGLPRALALFGGNRLPALLGTQYCLGRMKKTVPS